MREIGIDLSEAKPQKLTDRLAREAQLLISMGCGDKCSYVPGLRQMTGLHPIQRGVPWARCGPCGMIFESAS